MSTAPSLYLLARQGCKQQKTGVSSQVFTQNVLMSSGVPLFMRSKNTFSGPPSFQQQPQKAIEYILWLCFSKGEEADIFRQGQGRAG